MEIETGGGIERDLEGNGDRAIGGGEMEIGEACRKTRKLGDMTVELVLALE